MAAKQMTINDHLMTLFFKFALPMQGIPDHNYFMISDGTYCHLLPDKVVLGQKADIEFIPEMDHNNRRARFMGIIVILFLVAAGFTAMYFFDRMIIEIVIFLWMVAIGASYRLYLLRDSSGTDRIDKNSISSTKLVKRYMGYTTWVIFFTTDKGEKLRRFVHIYDSKEHEARAERLLREEGFL
jgi:hypothetical protein